APTRTWACGTCTPRPRSSRPVPTTTSLVLAHDRFKEIMSLLATKDLTIRFGGHVAVNGVTCAFQPGTLTAIVGPNGAGKTTYFNLISGQLKATAGQVTLNGRDLSSLSASERTRAGLGRAFQLTNLFPRLTVLENVRLAV